MPLPFQTLLYRYFFFGWLFKDLRSPGGPFERAAARRHNREQSRWLPLYMLRYGIVGPILFAIGRVAEAGSPVLSALFYVPCTLTVPLLAAAGLCWTALRLAE